jgi:hypothetical protein
MKANRFVADSRPPLKRGGYRARRLHGAHRQQRAVNDPHGTNVAQIVINGTKRATPEGIEMPAFRSAYSDVEIAAVANFVTGRFGNAASAFTVPRSLSTLRQSSARWPSLAWRGR